MPSISLSDSHLGLFAPKVLGLLCFVTILVSCYSYYDPYYETYSGFVGGKTETAFTLIAFACLTLSTTLLVSYIFSTNMSTVIPKTIFV